MRRAISCFLSAAFFIILGFLMLINPNAIVKIAVIAFGIYTAAEGIYSLVEAFKLRKYRNIFLTSWIKMFINLFIGLAVLILAARSEGASIANWIVYLIAFDLLLSAIVEIVELAVIRSKGVKGIGLPLPTFVSIVISVLMFLFPSIINKTIFILVAVIFLAIGAFALLAGVLAFKGRKNASETVIEAEWSEKGTE